MKSCSKSVKLHSYYSTQKYDDDSVTRQFHFTKKEFPKNQVLCLHNAWGVFRELYVIFD